MKNYSILFISILASVLLLSCQEDDNLTPKAKESIIVYMCADNNLNNVADLNIDDMVKGIDKDANVFVYLDQGEDNSHIYKLVPNNYEATISNPFATFVDLDSGSEYTVEKVIDHVLAHYPSESVGLILWSHGSGWMAPNKNRSRKAFGDDKGNNMSIKDLTISLKEVLGKHHLNAFEYILFDACLMGDIEVVSEMKEICNYMVASTDEILIDGYPYNPFMKALTNTNDDIESRLWKACDSYIHYYLNHEKKEYRHGSISLYKTSIVDALIHSMNNIISSSYMNYSELYYKGQIDFFTYEPFGDFIGTLQQHFTSDECKILQQNIEEFVVYTKSVDILLGRKSPKNYCGVSIFIPDHTFYYDKQYYTTGVWAEQSKYGVILANSFKKYN